MRTYPRHAFLSVLVGMLRVPWESMRTFRARRFPFLVDVATSKDTSSPFRMAAPFPDLDFLALVGEVSCSALPSAPSPSAFLSSSPAASPSTSGGSTEERWKNRCFPLPAPPNVPSPSKLEMNPNCRLGTSSATIPEPFPSMTASSGASPPAKPASASAALLPRSILFRSATRRLAAWTLPVRRDWTISHSTTSPRPGGSWSSSLGRECRSKRSVLIVLVLGVCFFFFFLLGVEGGLPSSFAASDGAVESPLAGLSPSPSAAGGGVQVTRMILSRTGPPLARAPSWASPCNTPVAT
mmetsp:Transcript_19258/g.56144  ORF Transcript_19258/g.56144 Transcript_19258/m.56144 type:complete len:296 (+) Transcript_19258:1318-2205(+)